MRILSMGTLLTSDQPASQPTHSLEPLRGVPLVKEQWLTSSGYAFAYKFFPGEDDHETPTLILCGAFQRFQSWNSYVTFFLAQGKPVLLLSLPGTGESEPLPPEFGIDFLAASILQLLDHLGLEKVSIISPSYSTPAAFQFAYCHPERITNLVLCGTMEEIPSNLRPYVSHSITTLREGRMEQFANEVLGITGPRVGHGLLCTDPAKPVVRRKLALRILQSQLINLSHDDRLRYEYNTLRLLQHPCIDIKHPPKVPTLVFTGEHDTFTKPHLTRRIAAQIPDSQFTTILEADHMFHIEQFAVTSELFYRFSHNLSLEEIAGIGPLERFPVKFSNACFAYSSPRSFFLTAA